jgi:hypothetical protein
MFGMRMCLFCVYVFLCLGRGLATSRSLVKGVLHLLNVHETENNRPGPKGAVGPVEKKRTASLNSQNSTLSGKMINKFTDEQICNVI